MAKVERSVVKPPNQELQGLAATRSTAPRAACRRRAGPNAPPDPAIPGGSADLTRQPSAGRARQSTASMSIKLPCPSRRPRSSRAKVRFRSTRSSANRPAVASAVSTP